MSVLAWPQVRSRRFLHLTHDTDQVGLRPAEAMGGFTEERGVVNGRETKKRGDSTRREIPVSSLQ